MLRRGAFRDDLRLHLRTLQRRALPFETAHLETDFGDLVGEGITANRGEAAFISRSVRVSHYLKASHKNIGCFFSVSSVEFASGPPFPAAGAVSQNKTDYFFAFEMTRNYTMPENR